MPTLVRATVCASAAARLVPSCEQHAEVERARRFSAFVRATIGRLSSD